MAIRCFNLSRLMLIYLSIKLARASIMKLSDATSKEMIQESRKQSFSEEGVLKNESLRARQVGL